MYWVKQHNGAIPSQVSADTPEEAIERAEAWAKEGPVLIETPDGKLVSLEEFRKQAHGVDDGKAGN